ncbi:TRAP transporter large permease [Clostridium sp.]|uniref:TRAP transporter large permease n=1 Tax=Clostridium sp. TaxID=1506 RepID=UPI001A5B6E8B|nr:TRAP transporter large permease [Clostridium sp.]MBK5242948.1 TRAP transporter large permease [Clostridium sp.]
MSISLFIMLVIFVVGMFLGIPLSFSMILSSASYLLASGKPLDLLSLRLFTGIDSFTLMAIPFFTMAANLMVLSGTTEKLLNFTNAMVGRFQGGLAYVNVLASMLFGGCSGSAIADVAGLGIMEIDMMEKGGYKRDFSTALTISSSIQGPLIPPSIMMVLIGATTGTSIGALLLGSAIPGLLVGGSQMMIIFIIAKIRHFPISPFKVTKFQIFKAFISAIPFLIMPIIIIGGILSGKFTPTEASAVAVAYGIILLFVFSLKTLKFFQVRKLLSDTAIISASILLLAGASNIFGYILSIEQIPQMLGDLLLALTTNKYIILGLVLIFLLMWGMVMDSLPAIMILSPILFPIAIRVGINPVHFGVVLGFALIIGLITPPYGPALFTGTIISGLPMEKLVKSMIPFLLSSLVILILTTFIPSISLWLPTLFGLGN